MQLVSRAFVRVLTPKQKSFSLVRGENFRIIIRRPVIDLSLLHYHATAAGCAYHFALVLQSDGEEVVFVLDQTTRLVGVNLEELARSCFLIRDRDDELAAPIA
ncbi:MAG: hypothetical protein ACREBQ_03890 [Nitrososphaerales archaeon]